MSAVVITSDVCFSRLCSEQERDYDRRYLNRIAMGRWRQKWREAKSRGDYAAMDALDREYDQIQGI